MQGEGRKDEGRMIMFAISRRCHIFFIKLISR
jgi:hypothetical protein